MKIDLKKINFKQPKYMIPLLIFFPLLFIVYQVLSAFGDDTSAVKQEVVTETVNTDMPSVNESRQTETKSKYQAMLDGFGKVTDYTGVVTDKEEDTGDGPAMQAGGVYSDAERRRIDSLMAVQDAQAERLRVQLEEQQRQWERDRKAATESSVVRRSDAVRDERIRDRGAASSSDEEYDRMVRQMQLVQKVASGEPILTEEDKLKLAREEAAAAERRRLQDSIARAEAPLAVSKAGDGGGEFFNTVTADDPQPNLIRARVDRVEKVRDGSRIRLRLDEDIEIDGTVLPKGSYLYASVRGFSAQRVHASVTSVLLGDRIKKINLSVYDLDGMEGFYVPSSNFREVSRDIAAGSMRMNVNVNNNDGGLEAIAMQSLQQALQGVTSATSKSIRANKARIKFNTSIYLVDNSAN